MKRNPRLLVLVILSLVSACVSQPSATDATPAELSFATPDANPSAATQTWALRSRIFSMEMSGSGTSPHPRANSPVTATRRRSKSPTMARSLLTSADKVCGRATQTVPHRACL
jgi:hypothetical protein